MSYKTEFGINLSVANGPPPLKQVALLEDVDATSGQRYTFNNDKMEQIVTAPSSEPADIRFCLIDADQFTYDDCGTKKPGIVLVIGEKEWPIDRSQIYINRPGQDLAKFSRLTIRVKKELLSTATKVVVTVTYGIHEPSTNGVA